MVGDMTIKGLKAYYGEGATGLPELVINSNGHLEIFIKQGRAADRCDLHVGQQVELI